MPRNDEGEFEMVLGNRQLFSIFFIVVILLAVFFTMGYLMGRGSGPGTPTLAKNGQPETSTAQKPDATPPGSEIAPAPAPAAGQQPAGELAPGQAVVSTTPATSGDTPPMPKPAPQPAAKPPDAAPAPIPNAAGPQPGETYLQVAATTAAEAELEVDVLRKRGFSALVAPVPNATAFRVLVGPMKDTAQIAKTKLDLEAIGFKQVIIRKY